MRYFRNRKRHLRESWNSPLRICAVDSDMCVELETAQEKIAFWNLMCKNDDASNWDEGYDPYIYTSEEWDSAWGWDESIEEDYDMLINSAYVSMDDYWHNWQGLTLRNASDEAEQAIEANLGFITSDIIKQFAR